MHIVLDARTATPHFPGIGRYVVNLARAILPELSPDERLTVLYDAKYPQNWPDSPQFRAVPLNLSPFGPAQQWAVPRLLKQLGADLYHSAYYLMPYHPGVPTVLTVYDIIPLRFPAHSTFQARLLFRWTTRLALRAAQRVIAISEAARQDFIRQFHLAPQHITAIPLAADPAFYPRPTDEVEALRRRYALLEHYALYLGSNKPHKNLISLVEAFSRLTFHASRITHHVSRFTHHASRITHHASRITLVIAGAWDPRYPEPRRRAEALGLDHIIWLGPLPEADLPALYGGATLFVFPSLYEGFGLPVLEAMACGTPVACSNTSSLSEVAGGATLTFDPDDVEAIADALCRLMTDADLRAGLRKRGLEQAAQFSWRNTARQTVQIYRRA